MTVATHYGLGRAQPGCHGAPAGVFHLAVGPGGVWASGGHRPYYLEPQSLPWQTYAATKTVMLNLLATRPPNHSSLCDSA